MQRIESNCFLWVFKDTKEIIRRRGSVLVNVAIIDDLCEERKIIREYLNYYSDKTGEIFSIKEFESGYPFLANYNSDYDIVFLDIEMPDLDGLKVATELRKIDKIVLIMFITKMSQFALMGYDVEAADYLVKPVDKYFFIVKLKKIIEKIPPNRNKKITIKTNGCLYSYSQREIKYVSVERHGVLYHLKNAQLLETESSLKEVEKKLSGAFIRCSSGFLVNLEYVNGIADNCAIIGKEKLPISRSKKSVFIKKYIGFLNGGIKNV